MRQPARRLQTDANGGHLVLPEWKDIEPKSLHYKKLFISKSMTQMYRASLRQPRFFHLFLPLTQPSEISVGSSTSRVRWASLEEAKDDFIEVGFTLANQHMRRQNINDFLQHWEKCQAAGKRSLRHRNLREAGRCGNWACNWAADSADTEPGDQENLQDAEAQAQTNSLRAMAPLKTRLV
jgi:hypothetical protein